MRAGLVLLALALAPAAHAVGPSVTASLTLFEFSGTQLGHTVCVNGPEEALVASFVYAVDPKTGALSPLEAGWMRWDEAGGVQASAHVVGTDVQQGEMIPSGAVGSECRTVFWDYAIPVAKGRFVLATVTRGNAQGTLGLMDGGDLVALRTVPAGGALWTPDDASDAGARAIACCGITILDRETVLFPSLGVWDNSQQVALHVGVHARTNAPTYGGAGSPSAPSASVVHAPDGTVFPPALGRCPTAWCSQQFLGPAGAYAMDATLAVGPGEQEGLVWGLVSGDIGPLS